MIEMTPLAIVQIVQSVAIIYLLWKTRGLPLSQTSLEKETHDAE